MTATREQAPGLEAALLTADRAPEIAEADDIYGWLVGSWHLRVLTYWAQDVRPRNLEGEVHAGRVLEGRAIQDVWLAPTRARRREPGADLSIDMYGTTLRVWDATVKGWRITWINPVTGHREEQIGRARGSDIVQIGARADGTPTRWTWTEVTRDSFHWLGEALQPDGVTWRLEGEFLGTRMR